MIKAKTVIPHQYWILRDRDHKVGNIEIDGNEYVVRIGDRLQRFNNLNSIQNSIHVDFERTDAGTRDEPEDQVHGYPTTGRAYNAVFDVRHRLPLWTTDPRSRSWLAAGWYRVRQHRNWQIMQCPKLIILQRYQYQGPFHSREEAQSTCHLP